MEQFTGTRRARKFLIVAEKEKKKLPLLEQLLHRLLVTSRTAGTSPIFLTLYKLNRILKKIFCIEFSVQIGLRFIIH